MNRSPAGREVVIVVDRRRSRTVRPRLVGDRIEVLVPPRTPRRTLDALIPDVVARFEARLGRGRSDAELAARTDALRRRYVPEAPAAVRVAWVGNQRSRWASTTSDVRHIRVSTRLQDVPEWVLDVVLVHEIAHLVHPDHSPAFWALAGRHPRQPDAELFLDGYSAGLAAAAGPGAGEGSAGEGD